ncbi:MAG TPA: penicillin-binding transpeptidase domain-containing protein [Myxococcota bacterium]|jgi:membrane peptidoglycan carboxypeptidase|nr:penicillin-binding transpeptidase domain-containing protein [Myxococcota bacterium]
MRLRGKLTLGLPLFVGLGAGLWLAGPEVAARDAVSAWLEPPADLRLQPQEAPVLPLPWAPGEVLARLPASRTAFEAALASADWLPPQVEPGRPLWESVPAPADRPDLVSPLRVQYTLDASLSRAVFDLLDEGHVDLGHVIVLDPATSDVLAYASTDVERFPPTETYPAASLIKVVTAAAALDRTPGAAQRACRYDGSPYRLTRGRVDPPRRGTEVSLRKALATSNNQCFAQLAVHELGAARMLDVIRRFGLLEAPAPAHAAGRASDPGRDAYELGRLGCGLAGCRITPLHAARLAGTIADGWLRQPRWVARVVDGSGRDLALPESEPPRRVLTSSLAAQVRDMMVETTVRGTARRAFHPKGRPLIPGVAVAGKTGSLSGKDPDGRYEWFIGAAPAERPRIAVAVVVVQGKLWHSTASQLSAQVLRLLFCDERGCSPNALHRWRAPATAPPVPAAPADAEVAAKPEV